MDINKFILLVEDSEAIRISLMDVITSYGYSVEAVCNGEEALKFLRENRLPTVIFLDLIMPVMDGLEFREHKNKDSRLRFIPTVITSGVSELRGGQKFYPLPHEIILPKPFDYTRLVDVIKNYCEPD